MLSRLRAFFAPPIFPQDEDKTRQAAVLNTLLLSVLAFLILDILVATPFIYSEKFFNNLAALMMLVKRALEARGYRLLEAENGLEAWPWPKARMWI